MKKITKALLTSFFFLLTAFSVLSTKTYAIDPAQSQHWVCLDAKRCDKAGANCSGKGRAVHRAKLSPDGKLPHNEQNFIVECIELPDGPICTTGNLGVTTGDIGQVEGVLPGDAGDFSRIGFKFEGLFQNDGTTAVTQPVQSDAGGSFVVSPSLEWQSSTTRGYDLKFFAISFFDPQVNTGGGGGDQNATFDFENANEDCESIRWDPFGVAFDARTLEPLNTTTVTIMKKNLVTSTYNKLILTGVTNPYVTKEDGGFSFVVPNGTYRLDFLKSNYELATQEAAVHPNWKYIYSDLYFGDDIIENGTITHNDAPLSPKGVSASTPATRMNLNIYLEKATGDTIVEGRLSHPFSAINVYTTVMQGGSPTKGRLLEGKHTDKSGRFKFVVASTDLADDESCCFLTYHKEDLRGDLTKFIKDSKPEARKDGLVSKFMAHVKGLFRHDVDAQMHEGTFSFSPILNYIEGYAYDANGKAMPNAKVEIYLKSATYPYYQTVTDEKGYFKINSEHLPFMPYTIKYVSKTGQFVNTTTSKFLSDNKEYITQNKIQTLVYKSSTGVKPKHHPKTTLTPKITEQMGSKNGKGKNISGYPNGSSSKKGVVGSTIQNNFMLVVGIIILIILGVIVAGLGIYLYKKKSQDNVI